MFLSYPPFVRLLSLLSENECMTKFEIGCQLGFIGEAGFTSVMIDASKYPLEENIEIVRDVVNFAKKYGATEIINYRNGNIADQILEKTDGKGVDRVVIAGGDVNTFADAVKEVL